MVSNNATEPSTTSTEASKVEENSDLNPLRWELKPAKMIGSATPELLLNLQPME